MQKRFLLACCLPLAMFASVAKGQDVQSNEKRLQSFVRAFGSQCMQLGSVTMEMARENMESGRIENPAYEAMSSASDTACEYRRTASYLLDISELHNLSSEAAVQRLAKRKIQNRVEGILSVPQGQVPVLQSYLSEDYVGAASRLMIKQLIEETKHFFNFLKRYRDS